MQERGGLRVATDGELRRRSWWLELIMSWGGLGATRQGASPFAWRNENGRQQAFSLLWLTGRLEWHPSPIARAVAFLAANTSAVPKVTIPAPQVVHGMLGGDQAIRESPYGDVEAFWEDLVDAYRREIAGLVAAGARYIQLDDTMIAFLCDPQLHESIRAWGQEPEQALASYAERLNQVLDGVSEDVTVALHQCRGNREGLWVAEGGYDFVADVMFNQINVDAYFLEYDTARAGTFEPLRHLPAGKIAALGLVSTKTSMLETKAGLKRRLEEAEKFAPIERLALSTQCGFASSVKGNRLSKADEEAKLALIVETASEVWPDA